jgi:adenylate kinase family enzyme
VGHALTVVLLSGPIGSGKTLLSEELVRRYMAERISTSGLLSTSAGRRLDRRELQELGLERKFQEGGWIADAVTQVHGRSPTKEVVVVDAVRTIEQVQAVRRMAREAWRTLHVHLTAEARNLADRYRARAWPGDVGLTWSQAMKAPGEATVQALETQADAVIDTTRVMPPDVAVRVASRIRPARSRRAPCGVLQRARDHSPRGRLVPDRACGAER